MPIRNDFNPGEFCWVDLNAHDLAAAAAWYDELFGWKHVAQETHGGPPYGFSFGIVRYALVEPRGGRDALMPGELLDNFLIHSGPGQVRAERVA